MQIETELKKWGDCLALRVSGVMAQMPKFKSGTKVTVDVSPEGLVVRRASASIGRVHFPYSESELLDGITPEKAHADELPELTELELPE